MTHSDKDITNFFHQHEIFMTNVLTKLLLDNNFDCENLSEKVHITIHLIDDLCHEIVYHKHKDLDYDILINLVIENILNLILKI